jgi:hypothetical protein
MRSRRWLHYGSDAHFGADWNRSGVVLVSSTCRLLSMKYCRSSRATPSIRYSRNAECRKTRAFTAYSNIAIVLLFLTIISAVLCRRNPFRHSVQRHSITFHFQQSSTSKHIKWYSKYCLNHFFSIRNTNDPENATSNVQDQDQTPDQTTATTNNPTNTPT